MKGTFYILMVVLVSFYGNIDAQTKSGKVKKSKKASGTVVYGDPVPTGKNFHIQSAINAGKNPGGCWDIPGHPKTIQNGKNIQSWNIDNGIDRNYRIDRIPGSRYYRIFIGNSNHMVVDISGNKQHNGANIQAWEWNGSNAQKFYFRHMGNGRYKIFNINGKAICLSNRSSSNGKNIHMWDDPNGNWMEWVLIYSGTTHAYRP